jgi:hypothetical protein
MVHSVPLPSDSTNRAIVVSTSDNSDPARIDFRMFRTDALEKKPDSFRAGSSLGRSCTEDCIADFILSTPGEVELDPAGRQDSNDHRPRKTSVLDLGGPPGNTGQDLLLGYTQEWMTRQGHWSGKDVV